MDMENVKLSIIVPVFNVEDFLPKCIDSIINQTYDDKEIILINDGSTDSSGSICDTYMHNKNANIKVIHKANGGLSSARNAGLDIAKGKYIAFVDSDDWVDKDMYKTLIDLLESNNADVAACSFKQVFSTEVVFESDSGNITILNREEAINSLISDKNSVRFEVWNKIFKREIIGDIRFKERQIFEDVFFDRNIFLKLSKMVYIEIPFYNYLKTREGNTNSHFNENKLKVFEEFNDFISDLKEYTNVKTVNRFVAFAIDFSIGLYCDASRVGASKEIKDVIIKNHKIYDSWARGNNYMNTLKNNLFLFSPSLFYNLFAIKKKFF